MKNKKTLFNVLGTALMIVSLLIPSSNVFAQSSSSQYRIEEAYFGTGGEVDASSSQYRARQSTGSLGVGQTSSTNFDAEAGANTPNQIFLEMVVSGADVNLGVLSPTTTSYAASQGGGCNCSFYVRSYLDSGYVVLTMSQPPTSESNIAFTPKSTQAAPSSNSSDEEFGMNLVANTVPGAMGAAPVNVPDNSFADGEIATGYENPNQYKYNAGDIIARSAATVGEPAIGQTNYTISYIMKPKDLTPAGLYVMRHDIVVVATF